MRCQSYGHSEDNKELVLRNQLDGVERKAQNLPTFLVSACPTKILLMLPTLSPHKTHLQTR